MRIHRDSIILISLQNHLNDVQSRVVSAVDGFHDLVGTDVSMTGHQRKSGDLVPVVRVSQFREEILLLHSDPDYT